MSFSAVILAGGRSSRMGRDKAFLEADGQTLLARQMAMVQAAGAAEIFISGRPDRDYSMFNRRVLLDEFSDAGPLAGIHAGLRAANYSRLLVLAVDLPNMTSRLLRRIVGANAGRPGNIPRLNGNAEPLAACYPKSALTLCAKLLAGEKRAARTFAGECVAAGLATFIDLSADHDIFLANCNSPGDIESISPGDEKY